MTSKSLILPMLLLLIAPAVRAEELSIAAAADLTYCLQDLNAAFQKSYPAAELKVSTGSSGNFFAQIKNGAPFDVFLSADLSYPRELIKAGLADEATLMQYAAGRIVLWTTNEKVDVTHGLMVLRDAEVVKKIAIANPEHAPYGRAARAALEHENLWKEVESRVVYGENIAQTAQFVETGNADAGIVALSLVLSPKLKKVGHYFEIPTATYPPLEQAAVITKTGAAKPLARTYLDFLRSPDARKIFDRYGFRLAK
ncbi:MAG: molybdate ABC transporter substrate-binding protein [Chthoniobacterales bacterium]|nr:MAG: molybdate ABC transporter substrate-binding protein [Chthoniobacterales bacterium]